MHAHVGAWMCLLNIKVWPGQSIFWGCFGLDCIPRLDMRHCTHGFVSRNMKPFHSGAACHYFPMVAQPKVPAGTDTVISRCKCKGDGGSIGILFHWSPPLDFADTDKNLSLGPECSPASWLECRQIHLDCWTVPCVVQKPFTSACKKKLLETGGKKVGEE